MKREYIALLGKQDSPTDGVQDYCIWLGQALVKRDWTLTLQRMPWMEVGWVRSLWWLWQESAKWRGKWVLVQYTAFSWSKRGFPLGFLVALLILRQHQARLAVIFHDPEGSLGKRLIDRMRRSFQHWVMQTAYRWADRSLLTLTLELIPWLPPQPAKAAFIPVGSNVPELAGITQTGNSRDINQKTVAIFGITGGDNTVREVADIAHAIKLAAQVVPRLRLVALGRGSQEAKDILKQALDGINVEVFVLGLLPQDEVTQTLAQSDVLLFIRGNISTGRTSALAGVACGLPIVAYAGPHTGFPLAEAGVLLVSPGDRDALAEALIKVLIDEELWEELHQRSLYIQREYFSWDTIADRFLKVLSDE